MNFTLPTQQPTAAWAEAGALARDGVAFVSRGAPPASEGLLGAEKM